MVTLYFEHLNKKIPLVFSKLGGDELSEFPTGVNVVCNEANLNQWRDLTDFFELFEVLPELIEDKKNIKQRDNLNIRISAEEKTKIAQMAKSRGYKSVSAYIKDMALHA